MLHVRPPSARWASAAAASATPLRAIALVFFGGSITHHAPGPAGMAFGASHRGHAGAGQVRCQKVPRHRAEAEQHERQPIGRPGSVLSTAKAQVEAWQFAQAEANLHRLEAYRDDLRRELAWRQQVHQQEQAITAYGSALAAQQAQWALQNFYAAQAWPYYYPLSSPLVTYGNSPQNFRHPSPMLHDPYPPDRGRHVSVRRHPEVPFP